mmetsp:Transcript_30517/g.76402  ORF Transcript_30517/g.76402 Transcript_30517/m.76402 type:complete len:219 (-) Transcript_30517:19-675(-)
MRAEYRVCFVDHERLQACVCARQRRVPVFGAHECAQACRGGEYDARVERGCSEQRRQRLRRQAQPHLTRLCSSYVCRCEARLLHLERWALRLEREQRTDVRLPVAKIAGDSRNLTDEQVGRGDHEQLPWRIAFERAQRREQEGERLAASSLGVQQHVVALRDRREGGGLDRKRRVDPGALEAFGTRVAQAQATETVRRLRVRPPRGASERARRLHTCR